MEFLGWIALAFIAGVLLNATPCVLPAVPIKLRVLLVEGGRSGRHRLATGLALLLGSLMFFGTLGALSITLQWSWGAPMGQPVFRGLLAATLILAAALLIFDLGRFAVPRRISEWRGRGPSEGFVVGFGGGILSLPCTGPFLGGVLAFSLAQSASMTMGLFIAIGAGMAAPYLTLLTVPGWAPRAGLSGRVGRSVNRVLGFGLLAGALFYAQEFLPPLLSGRGSIVLMVVMLAAWTLTGWCRRGTATTERVTAPVVLLLAVGIATFAPGHDPRSDGLQWQPITRAEARPGKVSGPALIEFTADWCINCRVLERTVYQAPEVADAANDAVATLQLDLTDFNTEAQSLLQSWDGTGLPYAVVIDADGRIHDRLRDLFGEERLVRSLKTVAP